MTVKSSHFDTVPGFDSDLIKCADLKSSPILIVGFEILYNLLTESEGCTRNLPVQPEHSKLIIIYYMDNGVLLETKTLVELICHCIRDQMRVFSYFTLVSDIRKFPAIFIVVVLKIQMVFGSYIKRI